MGDHIQSLVRRQPVGYALERAFYRDADIFELEMERIFRRRWLLVDHASRIPRQGDFFLVELGGESIIVLRAAKDEIIALLNVCRHRGSRICLEQSGHVSRLTCPYHAWTYALDGRLLSARQMPEGFDRSGFALVRCAVEVAEGLIFINLADRSAPSFDAARAAIAPFLNLQGLATAKIAARRTFHTAANWKLVLENFLECYHCLPAHPEYCAVNSVVQLAGDGSATASAEYLSFWREWRSGLREDSLAHFKVTSASSDSSLDSENPYAIGSPAAGGSARGEPLFLAVRTPIKPGFHSMSEDGRPVAPLMGRFREYDGGKTSVSVDYVGRMSAANDYATLFRFIPISSDKTDFEIVWLVREDAVEGRDYDLERLTWLWCVTTAQDKTLAENNQLGVDSRGYVGGPYSRLESGPADFVRWYLDEIRDSAG